MKSKRKKSKKNNEKFHYANYHYDNDSLLDIFFDNKWLYFAWVIEIIAIIVYLKILYFYLSFISKGLVTGEISSFGYKGRTAINESIDLLAIQFINWLKSLFT